MSVVKTLSAVTTIKPIVDKRCFTAEPCWRSDTCIYAQVPDFRLIRMHFQPNHVGSQCDFYQSKDQQSP